MNHEEVKKKLFQSSQVKKEYDDLKVLFDIKKEIIQLRISQGLSQKELAEIVGTQQSAISRLESGQYNPSIEFLSKIAHALGKELQINFH
ncbi:helix-turn-helix transcriptional regulator [Alkaliphilus serpentinus]|uniref:Helix-turn-helix transcriptional regulator n=1 Tax=Alkaliphilus serpentinus TaxID=1482731 RepID=A0A833HNE2_9FIRM|nr:helix-turn-helix transcriptional regulator [Alkaliphilus serpentinus]KAB3529485.1 helix-turn-helix transcriptional regulator [Alkaliphilus serpentinus]